jgi:ATP-binding cassette subfamily B protein
MTLIALCVLPVSGILIGIIVKSSQKFFKMQQDYLGQVNGIVEENFAGQQIVKLFNREEDVLKEFNKGNAKLYKSSWKAQFLSGLMMPLMMFVGNLAYVAIVVCGGFFVIDGKIKVGAIQSFIGYIKNFTQPISQLAQVSNMFQSAIACSERIFTFLEEDEETADGELTVEKCKGDIEFKNVSFGYVPGNTIIRNFSAKFNAGEQVAIVGPTGAGKTTIVNLLMRFYEINGGSITLDGIDIRKYKRSELRKQFAMVLQNPWLFSGTIMENLRYGNLDATDEQVVDSAKFAHAHRFISILPEQYNTVLNEETSNISAGQRQLLTIARSNLANAPITILDEATSSVDTTTEQRIQRGMEKLTWGRTSFIIAHRLSTIKNADTILVLKDGDIIEKGNHEALLAEKGFYSELYNSQFEHASVPPYRNAG